MTHLLSIENNTAQATLAVNSTSDYPTTEVITRYALLGGAVGGGITGIFMGVLTGNLLSLLILPFICALVGVFIGFIPALITGIILAKLKVRGNQFPVLIVGFLVSALSSLPIFGFSYLLSLLIGVVGMCSSFIVGHWALPKNE